MAKSEISSSLSLDIYFDFNCPFVYRAAMWLEQVKKDMGPRLTINWRYFSLEQVNSQQGPPWKIWEQPDDYPSRGLRAFRTAEAARRQGEAAFSSFHTALLKARHKERRDIAEIDTLSEVAASIGLDMARFRQDLNDRQLLDRLAEDHTFATDSLGVFGTPTLAFPKSQAVFLKMTAIPPPEESLSFFTELHRLADQRRYIQEIKRPQPPDK